MVYMGKPPYRSMKCKCNSSSWTKSGAMGNEKCYKCQDCGIMYYYTGVSTNRIVHYIE